jgi:SET domain-containing protein
MVDQPAHAIRPTFNEQMLRPDQPACYATRDIYEGEELFACYGPAWWKAFPFDAKLASTPEIPTAIKVGVSNL